MVVSRRQCTAILASFVLSMKSGRAFASTSGNGVIRHKSGEIEQVTAQKPGIEHLDEGAPSKAWKNVMRQSVAMRIGNGVEIGGCRTADIGVICRRPEFGHSRGVRFPRCRKPFT